MKSFFKKIISFILRIESELVLRKYKPKVVAITGSVGKTTTKDAVYAVVSHFEPARRSEKSFNSEIGLPLTILGLPNGWDSPYVWMENIVKGLWLFLKTQDYPKWLILEAGVGKPGDMKATASWLKTDAVIITAIGPMPPHIEFFQSRKHLIEEKSGLIQTLKKDGVLVLNADDEDVINMKSKSRNKLITYGFSEGVEVKASGDVIEYDEKGLPEGLIFRIDQEGKSFPVEMAGVFGRNYAYAGLAALALATGLKMNIVSAIEALKNFDAPPGRMRLHKGIKNTILIDDTYNSSPLAAELALKTLSEIKFPGRKIAVLGDMLELGRHTIEAHKEIGKIAKNSADILIVVGQRGEFIKDGAVEARMKKSSIKDFLNSKDAAEFLPGFIEEGDVILIKGSQGVRMERITEALLLDQANKSHLLVRQDEEWKKKE